MRSRRSAWILRGKRWAKCIANRCLKCRIQEKKLLQQRHANLSVQKFEQCKPWTNVCIDLARHIGVRVINNARSKLKTNPLLIACLNTGALAIQLMHEYSTSAFLLQWEHFVSNRGWPAWVHSNPGTQMKGVSKYEPNVLILS